MSAGRERNTGRSLLLGGCALGALGWISVCVAQAQVDPAKSAVPNAPAASTSGPGSLDMDVNPAAPASSADNRNRVGGLDTDVNPTVAAPAVTATPTTATAAPTQTAPGGAVGKPEVNAMSPDNVQAGARISTINPAPLEAPAPGGSANQPTIATPPATTTTTPLVTPAPAAAQSEPVNLDHPTVLDTADLKAGNTTISLYGIEGLQGDAAHGLQ